MILKKIITNEKFLANLLVTNQKQIVLDFGAGQGFLMKEIRSRGIACIGCDLEEKYKINSIQVAEGLEVGKDLIINSKSLLPFKDENFDFIVSNQVIEHVFNLQDISNELFRVLKPNGSAYLLFPTKEIFFEPHILVPFFHKFGYKANLSHFFRYIIYFLSHLLKRRPLNNFKKKYETDLKYVYNFTCFRYFNEIKNIFINSGFEVNDRSKYWFSTKYNMNLLLRIIVKLIHPRYFLSNFIVIKKPRI
jgi:SAM-dependent methyltransferase